MFVVKVSCRIEILQKTFITNILSTRLTAPGSPRMVCLRSIEQTNHMQENLNDVRFRAKMWMWQMIQLVLLIMSGETPKKVDESSKCFTCSSLCPGKERVYIFGKISHNFVEIIKSTLNMDVNCYANDTNTRLFVCKTSCYKRLLKFHDQRATEKAEEAKKEIKDAFQARPRAKRLLRPTDGDQEE